MQFNELMEGRSRLWGGGIVVVIHALMWQALNYQFPREQSAAIKPIRVSLVSNERLPEPVRLPELSAAALPVAQVFISTPQMNVQESRAITVSAPEPLVSESASVINPTAVAAPAPQTQLVSESEAAYIKKPEIRIPLASKRAKEQGTTILSVIFDARGLVDRISIYKTSGYSRLDEVAVRAVRSMQVKPYVKNGVAMPTEMLVPVEFPSSSAVTAG